MKKLLALVCALCLALSLVACGGGQDQKIDAAVSDVCSSAKVEGEDVEGKLKDAFTKLQADGYTDLSATGSLLAYIAAASQNLEIDVDWYQLTKSALDLGEGDKEKSLDIMGAATGYIFIFDRSVEAATAELQVDARKKGMEPSDYAKWVTEDFERWENEKSEQELVDNLKEFSENSLKEKQKELDEKKSAMPAEPVEVYSDDRVTISFASLDYPDVNFLVENKTDANITIQANAISFDGKSSGDITMSDDVAPQSKGYVTAKCHDAGWLTASITSGQLHVIDFDKSFESYNATWIDVPISELEREPAPMGETILYEDSNVRIAFNSVSDGLVYRKGVIFDVENLTDACITIQADSVSVNGFSYNDLIMSDNVAPHSIGTVIAKCDEVDTTQAVETVGGRLSIIDFDKSFGTYHATFTNIPIVGQGAAGGETSE